MAKQKENQKVDVTIDEVIAFCLKHSLRAEVVGVWVWVTFDEKPDESMRNLLKDFGFRFSARRRKWAHNCGTPSRAGKGDPWEKYNVRPISGAA